MERAVGVGAGQLQLEIPGRSSRDASGLAGYAGEGRRDAPTGNDRDLVGK